jgi:hypothetical protein
VVSDNTSEVEEPKREVAAADESIAKKGGAELWDISTFALKYYSRHSEYDST